MKSKGIRDWGLGIRTAERSAVSSQRQSAFSSLPTAYRLLPTSRRRPCRRGVLLLIILGMLAMFAMIGVAFVMVTGHAERGATAFSRMDRYEDPPEKLLNEAFLQAVRGTESPASVLRPHSLLEDMYGGTSFNHNGIGISGTVEPARPIAEAAGGGQLLNVPVTLTQSRRYVGCVLTMLDGPAAGKSTRIVGYNFEPTDRQLQVLAFDGVASADLTGYSSKIHFIINGSAFGGTGFGYDGGATAGSPLLTAEDPDISGPYALLPNPTAFTPLIGGHPYADPAGPGGANEDYDAVDFQNMLLAMQVPPTQNGGISVPIPSLHRPELIRYWMNRQSFSPSDPTRQPEWATGFGDPGTPPTGVSITPTQWRALKRRICLRPLPEDHFTDTNNNGAWDPNESYFTGSNPSFNPANGELGHTDNLPIQVAGFNAAWDGIFVDEYNSQGTFVAAGDGICDYRWDVDNDGDGVPDSVWVDLGMPVRAAKDGRLYKPLFAILCVDLDGRLNLNAHGCLAQTNAGYYGANVHAPNLIFAGGVGDAVTPITLARGQGVGPAEINLLPVLGNDPTQLGFYRNLLYGNTTLVLDGRYGEVALGATTRAPGWTVDNVTPPRYANDLLSVNRELGFPMKSHTDTTLHFDYEPVGPDVLDDFAADTGVCGSLLDLKGSLAVGLDLRGQPLLAPISSVSGQLCDSSQATVLLQDPSMPAVPNHPYPYLTTNDPYELDLSSKTARGQASPSASADNPFSPAELERLLRPFDVDAARLPDRLERLTYDSGLTPPRSVLLDHRQEITTESWDVPCPGLATVASGGMLFVARSIRDTLIQKLKDHNPAWPLADKEANAEAALPHLLPPEVLAGLRMDLNRPFGNGLDDDGNGVIDEPNERETLAAGGNLETLAYQSPTGPVPVNFDDDNDGIATVAESTPGAPAYDGYAYSRQLYARHLYVMMLALMNYTVTTPGSPTPTEQAAARRVAQWAVNMVDFRDRDSIMTGFEYDVDPFNDADGDRNPWDVNGRLGPEDLADPDPDDTETYRGLVWGCERPELLITETLAFHDRRTEDTTADPTGKATGPLGATPPNDDDFDQTYLPQGSLFVELYNPWTSGEPGPGELYTDSFGTYTGGVVLGKLSGGVTPSPVWRLVTVDGSQANTDPDDPATLPGIFERAIYFVGPTACPTLPPLGTVHDLRSDDGYAGAIAPILPGRYAVIGPGEPAASGPSTTYVGFANGQNPNTPGTSRRIELTPIADHGVQQVAVSTVDLAAPTELPAAIQPAVAVVINEPQRLSISEPWGGYTCGAIDPASPPDTPQDNTDDGLREQPMWNAATVQLKNYGTFATVKVIHLQRLANPLIPFDPDTNPYRTIDSMGIDLTSFNGVTGDKDDNPSNATYPEQPVGVDQEMRTRERGDNNEPHPPWGTNNLWAQEPLNATPLSRDNDTPAVPLTGPTTSCYYDEPIHHTLGYVNWEFTWDPNDPGNQHLDPVNSADNTYDGSPQSPPFPWLTWNNRPFVNPLELLQVLTADSSHLLSYVPDPATTAAEKAQRSFRIGGGTRNPYGSVDRNDLLFPHLINFFYGNEAAGASPNWKLYRLLDFVQVPSRFAGTTIQGEPTNFANDPIPPGPLHSFHPPFNQISTYREPGRVNINTVFTPYVWQGLTNYFPNMNPAAANMTSTWPFKWIEPGDADMLTSRRGYPPTVPPTANNASGQLGIDPAFPTRFANPFRPASAADLVPIPALRPTGLPPNDPYEINVTLLRENPISPGKPLFENTSANPVNNTDRNAHFYYQGLQRLGNLITTRSNVYAVWITVGYFEVHPAPTRSDLNAAEWAAVYPDGYALGQELGSDTGETARHRAFYIFDRSIPMGFERGKNHNVENGILLRRFIE